jgi:pimeloyl-ACP methyl ester carboxylesterase
VSARQEAADVDENGPDVRAVVQIFPGSMVAGQRSALASSLCEKGLEPWMQRQVAAGMPQPSPDALLTQAEAERLKIAEQHGQLPVILLGLGFGAPVAGALLHRLPDRFAGAIFWDMPMVPPLQRATLLVRLRWEKLRLGSDVPSRVLRSTSKAPPTVGLAIAALELGRRISPDRLVALGKVLPILNIERGKHFAYSSETSGQYRNHDLNDLNQDVSVVISEWVDKILKARRSTDQPA